MLKNIIEAIKATVEEIRTHKSLRRFCMYGGIITISMLMNEILTTIGIDLPHTEFIEGYHMLVLIIALTGALVNFIKWTKENDNETKEIINEFYSNYKEGE